MLLMQARSQSQIPLAGHGVPVIGPSSHSPSESVGSGAAGAELDGTTGTGAMRTVLDGTTGTGTTMLDNAMGAGALELEM